MITETEALAIVTDIVRDGFVPAGSEHCTLPERIVLALDLAGAFDWQDDW